MSSWEDVRRIAAALPGAEAGTSWGRLAYKVDGRPFVNLRPLSQRDRRQLADLARNAPEGELPLVRVELERASPELLEELVTESFLICGGTL